MSLAFYNIPSFTLFGLDSVVDLVDVEVDDDFDADSVGFDGDSVGFDDVSSFLEDFFLVNWPNPRGVLVELNNI